jgi:proteasome assembly chaperone (PAC2) family protein
MPATPLRILREPRLTNATMLLAFTGWMDGGLVSTGTVKRLRDDGKSVKIAEIESDPYYIYNFPGDMETSALFRPAVKYVDGLVQSIELPANEFFCDEERNIVFFIGKEPNLAWQSFGDCVFDLAAFVGVSRMVFIGSFGGSVPHTREPRLYASVSHEKVKPWLEQYGVKFSDYEGPGSFSSYLTARARTSSVEMISIAAEIPGYLEGMNPLSIEAVTRRLAKMLDLPVNLDTLRRASNEWENQVTEAVEKNEELAENVRKLEEQYDDELIEGGEG